MAFRVISGNPAQPGSQGGDNPQGQSLTVKPGSTPARAGAAEQNALMPLLERLETLSFTFEALNAGSRTYAAEAVLETLGRMERRDLQSLAAIEAFASALKTVSQHLAGLRNAIQTTAHDTAHGFHVISERLDQLETQLGAPHTALPAAHGSQLAIISERLGHIEELVGQHDGIDTGPLTSLLEQMAHKVEQVEEKIDDLPSRIVTETVDMAPVNANLETIAERVASVERKIDEAHQIDVAPLREALDTIARRVSRIERHMESAPKDQGPEAFDPAPITEVLNAISSRISSMENKVESGANLGALTSFLDMVNQRLERMESGLNMAAISEQTEQMVEEAQTADVPSPSDAIAPEAAMIIETPAVKPQPPVTPVIPPPLTAPADSAPANRQQVDNLLEQVLKVLSR